MSTKKRPRINGYVVFATLWFLVLPAVLYVGLAVGWWEADKGCATVDHDEGSGPVCVYEDDENIVYWD
jgi:hypothetical protein